MELYQERSFHLVSLYFKIHSHCGMYDLFIFFLNCWLYPIEQIHQKWFINSHADVDLSYSHSAAIINKAEVDIPA